MKKQLSKLHLGKIVKKLREDKGLDQKELASLVGVTSQYVSDVERGMQMPSVKTLSLFASALDRHLWELVKDVEERMAAEGDD